MKTAAILWTGGKDSALAMLAVRDRLRIACLVTFVPDPPRPFLAHPIECIRAQAGALGLEHRAIAVQEPLQAGYERAIASLAEEGIDALVTGDMDEIAGHDNWVIERSRGLVEVERPLWHADRATVLRGLLVNGMDVVCMLARNAAFDETIVGRTLDAELVEELIARHGRAGFDACGENGEYHTCVLDAPGFAHALHLNGARVEEGVGFHRLAFDSVGRGVSQSSGERQE